MNVHYQGGGVTVLHGDCIEEMRTLPDASVHAVITDPPYGLKFMGREWDGADGFRRSLNAADAGRENVFGRASRTSPEYKAGEVFGEWCAAWAAECLRVLKPGGHLLAFGGSRTWHRLAVGIEEAGFELRDSIAWLYGSGFPKSLDVSKAIDNAAGAERSVVDVASTTRTATSMRGAAQAGARGMASNAEGQRLTTAPVTEAARQWEGWGTALKPAFEPIVVARKPLAGTVASNVLAHGTGALNIDATRIATGDSTARVRTRNQGMPGDDRSESGKGAMYAAGHRFESETHKDGRWPTNVLLDESQAAALDEQSGTLTSGTGAVKRSSASDAGGNRGAALGAESRPAGTPMLTYGDSGGASRYFPNFRYEAKAPASERPSVDGVQHPTVKPLDLMRWLVRLVTPPGGTVLEPFAGSGTTVEACLLEGFSCIAIEREADYLPLIMSRIEKDHEQSLFGDWEGGAA